MPKAIKNSPRKKIEHHPEAKGLLFIAISTLLFLCLASFVEGKPRENWLGAIGYFVAYGFHYLFGLVSYFFVTFLGWLGFRLIKTQSYSNFTIKALYFSLFIFSSSILLNLLAETKWVDLSFFYPKVYSESAILKIPLPVRYTRYNLGGAPFYYLYRDLPNFNLEELLGNLGVLLTFSLTWLVSFILLTDLSFLSGLKTCLKIIPLSYDFALYILKKTLLVIRKFFPQEEPLHADSIESVPLQKPTPTYKFSKPKEAVKPHYHRKPIQTDDEDDEDDDKEEEKEFTPSETAVVVAPVLNAPVKKNRLLLPKGSYNLPPLTLLTDAKKVDQTGLKKELKKRSDILEETLMSFGIEAKVGNIYAGPTVTLFEVHPAIGVKVQKIKALENDIALNLQAKSIRIIAPIPGKAAVGVEIPSLYPQEVGFKEMLSTYRDQENKFHIPVLLGKTVSGEDVLCDLTKMPHCVVAGATGSGKSVCINTIIMSILMNLTPDEVRLLLVDPKKVELTPFSHLPHLIAPVITEARDAYGALQWLVKEMQFRYEVLKRLGLRNITAFNKRKIDKELEATLELQIPEKMFFIVCIIDEFADLMMTSSADLETPIARIAQMARAVGIHLMLATQRPSREVITGLIKANFPTRIAFKVSSRINSQIILDENGAESLLGNGDMLFLPPGTSQIVRCQGVYVRDEDINKVVSYINERMPTNYLIESFEGTGDSDSFETEGDEPSDPLYEKALELVLSFRTASTTFLQRKLKIGYARAASLMDELEQNGVISPADGSRPRKILRDAL
ncbi:MAG: DNA translocase FtsK [Chlamydiae bacterium]|jgi:S-DNA-T family DNA segregation ATPase FtsK/SpoIIIE|nr:DNA translocase FtsK [Chlamydiota bacterium]